MIRFILLVLFLFSFLLFGLPILGAEWIYRKYNQEASDYQCLRIVQWAFKVLLLITGVSVTVIGEENVPDEPVLFIANHRNIRFHPGSVICVYIYSKRRGNNFTYSLFRFHII